MFSPGSSEELPIMEMCLGGLPGPLAAAPSPRRPLLSQNECKEILLACLVMYFL